MRRGPAVLLLIVLLLGAAYGAWRAAVEGAALLSGFRPATAVAERPAAGSAPLADRVVLFIIDGLRIEDAHRLPAVDWLRRRGAGYRLASTGFGGRAPLLASLLTGAPPTHHGLLEGDAEAAPATDDLLQAAARGQVPAGRARGLADPELAELLGPGGPRLVIVEAGELAGGRTEAALAGLDARLVALFDLIDWRDTAVVLLGTADAAAGVPSPLPLVLAGSGVLAGAGGDASLYDFAPTVAALTGLPTPVAAQGRPILSALAVEGRPLDAVMQVHLESRRAWAAAAAAAYGAPAEVPPAPATAIEAEDYLATLERLVSDAREAWLTAGAKARLPYLGPGLLILLLYLLLLYRSRPGGAAFRAHLVYAALFTLLFLALGGGHIVRGSLAGRSWAEWAYLFGAASAVASLLAAVTAGFVLSRREYRQSRYLAAGGLHAALGLVALNALPAGALVLLTGWSFPVALPPFGLWAAFFIAALQVVVIGGLGPVWAWTAVRAARFARHRWPPREVGDPEINADKVVRLRAIRRADRHRRKPADRR
ncbi:hypothetical protein [Symbiobacterium terraclitae]|uniref:hypothetical protein n=1 Tax=Symbiobacterium terraclitae TaxID=557451 RepID=UPI0035B546A5